MLFLLFKTYCGKWGFTVKADNSVFIISKESWIIRILDVFYMIDFYLYCLAYIHVLVLDSNNVRGFTS